MDFYADVPEAEAGPDAVPEGQDMQPRVMGPNRQRGILGQPALLAYKGLASGSAPVRRGFLSVLLSCASRRPIRIPRPRP